MIVLEATVMSTTPQSTSAAVARPSVIQLAIKEKRALYAAYIPLFAEGGIFIPSTREHRLGDPIYALITLLDDPQRYPIAGTVAWITPARASGGRTQGVGIQFPNDPKSAELKSRIEEILGSMLHAEHPTETV
jgi:type IV pilus assembly protein PilZ